MVVQLAVVGELSTDEGVGDLEEAAEDDCVMTDMFPQADTGAPLPSHKIHNCRGQLTIRGAATGALCCLGLLVGMPYEPWPHKCVYKRWTCSLSWRDEG